MQEMWVWSPDQEDPLKKEMETHSSILAWEITRTEDSTIRGIPKESGTTKQQQ